MNEQEQRNKRHLERSIEHCVSVIALCRAGGQTKAEASYEAQLERLRAELMALEQERRLEEAIRVSIEHKEVEGLEIND